MLKWSVSSPQDPGEGEAPVPGPTGLPSNQCLRKACNPYTCPMGAMLERCAARPASPKHTPARDFGTHRFPFRSSNRQTKRAGWTRASMESGWCSGCVRPHQLAMRPSAGIRRLCRADVPRVPPQPRCVGDAVLRSRRAKCSARGTMPLARSRTLSPSPSLSLSVGVGVDVGVGVRARRHQSARRRRRKGSNRHHAGFPLLVALLPCLRRWRSASRGTP